MVARVATGSVTAGRICLGRISLGRIRLGDQAHQSRTRKSSVSMPRRAASVTTAVDTTTAPRMRYMIAS